REEARNQVKDLLELAKKDPAKFARDGHGALSREVKELAASLIANESAAVATAGDPRKTSDPLLQAALTLNPGLNTDVQQALPLMKDVIQSDKDRMVADAIDDLIRKNQWQEALKEFEKMKNQTAGSSRTAA